MNYQSIFKRYELKYLITEDMRRELLSRMADRLRPDSYGASEIRNVYFDTDTFLLIRNSIEKPVYKEKLRIRSYSAPTHDSQIFVEMKKKYDSVVYKRRVAMTESEALDWLTGRAHTEREGQIVNEIDYFIGFYQTLRPRLLLTYEREAFYSLADPDFRITFDTDVRATEQGLTLASDRGGYRILEDGLVLMELKCAGGLPLWCTSVLSDMKIFKTPFSKYGEAYKKIIFPRLQERKK